MGLEKRIEQLEQRFGLAEDSKYDLGIIEAKRNETLERAVARVAKERGLELRQVGYAWVLWGDQRAEEYRNHDGDVRDLIGWTSHESALAELE